MITLTITGCGILSPRKPTIQQGNIIEPTTIEQLHVGMSKQQVRDLMGSPVLTNTFNQNRWEYVYTFQKGKEPRQKQHITIEFKNGNVTRVTKSDLKN